MQVKDVMTENPTCCKRETNLQAVARMMVECDCGEIPVVDPTSMKPIGVVTDRDIACRTVAEGKNPLELTAADCMTSPCVTVPPGTDLEECCRLMEEHQLRRIIVTDMSGRACGIVSQADIARKAAVRKTAEVVKEVSQPAAA